MLSKLSITYFTIAPLSPDISSGFLFLSYSSFVASGYSLIVNYDRFTFSMLIAYFILR